MKKYILSALLACLCFLYALFPLSPPARISADATSSTPQAGDYACVLRSDVFFYATRDESTGLFLLPESYYVKLLDYAPDFCKIEYLYDNGVAKKLVGYAKTSLLTPVEYVPQTPYLYKVLEVTYLPQSDATGDTPFLDKITVQCAYYGDYVVGSKTYCYVLRNEQFGYIPKPADFTYARNDEYDTYISSPPETQTTSSTKTDKGGASAAQIAILVALCLLVPVLAALILKPPRRPPYEDEN